MDPAPIQWRANTMTVPDIQRREWHHLPRDFREAITEYGTAMYDLGASKPVESGELARIERVSRARDALTAMILTAK